MNFSDTKEYIKKNKKIDGHKFNKATDITNMIDFLNNETEQKADEKAGNDVREISKFLVNLLTRKTILLKDKK